MNRIILWFALSMMVICPIAGLAQTTDTIYYAEPDTLYAVKEYCNCTEPGYRIAIYESRNHQTKTERCDYVYQHLFEAAPAIKIKLIEALLNFEKDTAASCIAVKCYRRIALEYSNSIVSKRYSMQIAALYHINMICFGPFSTYYAPYPVLYRKADNAEINDNAAEISKVFEIYRDWFQQAKRTHFSNFSFPLLGTRYGWK